MFWVYPTGTHGPKEMHDAHPRNLHDLGLAREKHLHLPAWLRNTGPQADAGRQSGPADPQTPTLPEQLTCTFTREIRPSPLKGRNVLPNLCTTDANARSVLNGAEYRDTPNATRS
ncbi:hypothetical protein DFH09DRAFT_1087267 [Mycena vulgaris]|nr:hypothetical protein DFH09DRAFT_1087267 [Mycena vulgaris]